MTVTGVTLPEASKTWVIFCFRPIKYFITGTSRFQPLASSIWLLELHHFQINTHATWQLDVREGLNDLGRGAHNIKHSLVHSHFKLFARIFVDESSSIYGVLLDLGW